MPEKRGRFVAFWRLTKLSGLIAGFFLLPLLFPFFKENCAIHKKVRALRLGAHFVTDKGIVLQSKDNDCGPASLKMILAAHGIERSLSDLAFDLRLAPNGTSMLNLRLVSIRLGVPARSWAVQPADLCRVPLPAIAFVNQNHFVVIRRFISSRLVEVDDPSLGRLRWPVCFFKKFWTGEMLVFDPDWAPNAVFPGCGFRLET